MNQMSNTTANIIVIDGPAGAGKSTVARKVAQLLGYAFLDTGAMYRAATWWAMHHHVDMDDAQELVRSTTTMPLDMHYNDQTLTVLVDGIDITQEIRTPEVTNAIRNLDAIPELRKHLVKLQRDIAAARPTVADGRDMGTVVFPNARCKIFLIASLEVRAKRRVKEMHDKGLDASIETVQDDIERRDNSDRNRATAPLKPAEDAHILDTSDLSVEQVVDAIVERARAAS